MEMEMFQEKEKGPYQDKLSATAKKLYLDKLSVIIWFSFGVRSLC